MRMSLFRRSPLALLLALLVVSILGPPAVACRSTAGGDPVVVRAEEVWENGFATVNSFLKIEDAARRAGPGVDALAFLQKPDVHEFAERLRRKINPASGEAIPERFGKWAFDKLDEAIQAYRSNRTPDHAASVQTWMKVAEELLETAQQFMGGGTS